MNLPAGILPKDFNIELFADPERFGKCYFIQNGQTKQFCELPLPVIANLYNELYLDRKAVKALSLMGIKEADLLEQYNFCNRGKLDTTPDITAGGKLSKEYFDCGKHDTCIGEGRVCGMYGLTFREKQCIRLNAIGKDYQQIQSEMGFRSVVAVNSLMSRCRSKVGAKNRTELLVKSYQIGIV